MFKNLKYLIIDLTKKKNFKKEKIDLRKKSATKTHILETKKIIHHNETITQKNEEFLNNIDKNIDNIRKIISKNIDELKNKKIYITLDRYGIKDTKYLPHIKPISVFTKNVKFSNINTKQTSNSLTNKFEEIKENFTNKKTLFDLTKSLFYVLEIFHPFTENKVEFDEIFDNDIKLNAIGEIKSLPKELVSELDFIINKTRKNTKMTLTLALSYGGKQEIFNAIKIISNKVKNNLIELNNFDDSIINSHLYTKNLPDVDLLIRTSGEQRISNFLLWQIAYAELYFTDVYWPDFSKDDFNKAIENYKTRERRFGKTSEQI